MGEAPEIQTLRRAARLSSRQRPPRHRLAAIAASLAVLVLAVPWAVQRYAPAPLIYQTGLLEWRKVALADGSRITLDSASRVQVRLTPGRRRIELLQGRAKFEVAHDPSRPFTVQAGDRSVLATGTVFDVETLGRQTVVTLLQGKVVVRPVEAAPEQKDVSLSPGDRFVAPRGGVGRVAHVDPTMVGGWEDGKLLFDDEPLEEVISRLNRYTPRRWSVDPSLRSLRISGLFDAGNVDAFLSTLSDYFSIDVSVGSDQTIILRPGSPSAPARHTTGAAPPGTHDAVLSGGQARS